MISDKDINKLKTIFPTKDDLKKELRAYATKEDLKNELKGFATKADLKAHPTKDDLKSELRAYATKDEMSRGFMEVIRSIGETRTEIVTLITRQIVELQDVTKRQQRMLENHDSRIGNLESLTNLH